MSKIQVDDIVNRDDNGAPSFPYGAIVTGVVTATSFDGNLTGNADTATNAQGLAGNPSITVTDITSTGNVSIAGTLTYEDVTNVDSIGIITAQSDISIADKIVHTGDTDTAIRFPAADTFTVETAGSERVRVTSAGNVGIGTNSPSFPLTVSSTNATVCRLENTSNTTAFLTLEASNTTQPPGMGASANELVFNTAFTERIRIDSAGSVGIGTNNPTTKLDVVGGLRFAGEALENVNITAGTLLANQNIDLTNGMVHYFTSNETGISTANIRIDGSTSLDSTMNTGNTAAVTILTTPNNAGYSTCINIDGSYNVVQWLSGAAPSAGGATGIDAYSYQIIKTGSATFTVLGSVNNFA